MAETVEDRLKIEVENYNNLNQKKKELEVVSSHKIANLSSSLYHAK